MDATTIKDLRSRSNMTQKDFAEYFGIPKRTLEDWERGARKCPDYLVELMEYKLETEQMMQDDKSRE